MDDVLSHSSSQIPAEAKGQTTRIAPQSPALSYFCALLIYRYGFNKALHKHRNKALNDCNSQPLAGNC